MPTENVAVFNAVTGEIRDTGIMAFVPKKIKMEQFMFLFQDGCESLAKMNLTWDSARAFLFMLSKLDYQNRLHMTQREIANELNMQVSNLNRAMKLLSQNGIVALIKSGEYVVSDQFVWRGSLHDASPEVKARGAEAWKKAKAARKEKIIEEQSLIN